MIKENTRSAMSPYQYHITGLTDQQVINSRSKHGSNKSDQRKESGFLTAAKNLFSEPMFLLLLAASTIYFISGKPVDGIFMLVAIVLVAAISLYQESRSRNAIEALQKLTQPYSKVIRDGVNTQIPSEEIVVGDIMIVEEGTSVPADGKIIQSNDFLVNEAIITGESLPVSKSREENTEVYQGTTVMGGLALCEVTHIGNLTRLGKIGKSIEQIEEEDTPLQLQIRSFVKKMALVGAIIFAFVWIINFYSTRDFLNSLLQSLTLAMSILPEEIPVAFTTFMALGAWRLMKLGIVVKQTKTVETLGSATVICIDKTGTITENKMSLVKWYVHATRRISTPGHVTDADKELIRLAMWSSEPIPFDPMEVALHEAYVQSALVDERSHYKLIFEYPLEGRPPMMTHIFERADGHRMIAAKGAPEALIQVSDLSAEEKKYVSNVSHQFASDGYRVLGVGIAEYDGSQFHSTQQQYKFRFAGLVAFHDPPRKNFQSVLDSFYQAGIGVKMLTGDNAATATTIARQVGFRGVDQALNGEELMNLTDDQLKDRVLGTTIFTRMFPEAKLRIINALKSKGEIVAMTGDGVNDGPALKAAHIGISMGKKGSEIARQASSLVLMEDDLNRMVDAIAMGRKIYTNLKKAIQYIISIHIPIILVVFLPLALGWVYPGIFTPIHIIFLELIMGPTCSIMYENEPLEKNVMLQKPRPFTTTFFNFRELTTSLIQGLAITIGALTIYQIAVNSGADEATTRTMVFLVLISANIFLTLVNRSFYYSILTTATYKNHLVPIIIMITILLTALLLLVSPLTAFFEFKQLSGYDVFMAVGVGFISVIWFEVVKWRNRIKNLPADN